MGAKIARDTQGVRLRCDGEDLAIISCNRYEIIDSMDSVMFVVEEGGANHELLLHGIREETRGLRKRKTETRNLSKTFTWHEVFLDFESDGSFEIELPAIHELPWPHIRSNDPDNPNERAAICIAERLISMGGSIDLMSSKFVSSIGIPDYVRKWITGETRGRIVELVKELR